MSRPGLMETIARARAEIRGMKKCAPWMPPEWQELRNAEDEFKRAGAKLKQARAAWKALGKDQK